MTSMTDQVVCAVLTQYGNHQNVTSSVRPPPPPAESGQLQIRMHAFGLNFSDMYAARGLFRTSVTPSPPFVMGREGAGQVVMVGSDVRDFKVGDRVACFCMNLGVWAEYINVKSKQCIKISDEMSYTDAAAFFVNYLTAYCSLFYFGNLTAGHTVFVHSVAGGVGCAATQLVKALQDTKIIGTASESKHVKLKQLGVDHLIDTTDPAYVENVLQKYPQGVDIVLDNRSGADFGKGRNMLGQMGKIVHLGANNVLQGESYSGLKLLKTWWDVKNVSVFDLVMSNQSVSGFNLANLQEKNHPMFLKAAEELKKLYLVGKVKPQIDSVFELEKASEAVKYFEERKSIGKIVLVAKLP